MEFDEVVLGRRSIRGYKPDPVPKEVIEEVLELAVRSPSSMNTQPWHLYVVTGDPLDKIRRENTERNISGVPPSREIRTPNKGYEGLHRERQIEIAVQLFQKMGIERDDKEKDEERRNQKRQGKGNRFQISISALKPIFPDMTTCHCYYCTERWTRLGRGAP